MCLEKEKKNAIAYHVFGKRKKNAK